MLVLNKNKGFTLVELLIVVAVVAVIATLAVPSYRDSLQRHELISAVEGVYSYVQYARSESIANNEDIYIAFKGTGATGWCLGISDLAACDCAASLAACTINSEQARSVDGSNYPNVTLTTSFGAHDSGFNAPRMTAMENGTITVTHSGVASAGVVISTIGRVRVCSDSLDEYSGC
jgi:prepilin-type N-terminal cleavage/methylation domain-containing protein